MGRVSLSVVWKTHASHYSYGFGQFPSSVYEYHSISLLVWVGTVSLCIVCIPSAFLSSVCGDLNGHHQEWLGSTTTNRHGVATFDFTTISVCDQLVVGRTHARGGTLDLLMTDVPDLIRVAVVAQIGNSDHSSLSAVILMAQAVAKLVC